MNFLAHAFLSGDDKDLIIGNFIADAVKGKDYQLYREGITKGILLHRKIDAYTDSHPVVAQTKARLRAYFGKYAGVVSDIYYDHFLAIHWASYSAIPLAAYTQSIYSIVRDEYEFLPEEVKQFFPYMVKHDWLYGYRTFEGLDRVFNGMSRRTRFDSKMENGVQVLKEYYQAFDEEFSLFFPELHRYVLEQLLES